jgi:hypothetical protein
MSIVFERYETMEEYPDTIGKIKNFKRNKDKQMEKTNE